MLFVAPKTYNSIFIYFRFQMTHVNELALINVWTLQSHIIQGKIFSFVEQKPDFTNDICYLLENLSAFVNTSRRVDLEQTGAQLLFTCFE